MLQYIIAFVTILAFLLVFIQKPNVETYIKFTLWTLPVTDTKLLPLEYGLIKVFDILTFIAFIFLFKSFITLKNNKTNLGYFLLAVFFICISLVSKYFSEFPYERFFDIYPIFTLFIFSRFFIQYLFEDFNRRYELIHILKSVFYIFIGFMLIQLVVGPSLTYYNEVHGNVFGESFSSTRFPGLFLDSQTNGQFLAMASFLFLLFKSNSHSNKKVFGFISFGIISICIVLAGSRSALGGFLIGLFFLFLFASLKSKLLMLSLAGLAVGLILLVKPDNSIFSRAENLGNDYNFRESIWIETVDVIKDYPFLGIGLGNFEKFLRNYKQDLNIELEPGVTYYYFIQPENGYLKIMVEHGLMASFFLFGTILFILFKSIFQIVQKKVNPEVLYLICSIIALLIAFNTVYSFSDYRIACLFSILICLVILYSNFTLSPYRTNVAPDYHKLKLEF